MFKEQGQFQPRYINVFDHLTVLPIRPRPFVLICITIFVVILSHFRLFELPVCRRLGVSLPCNRNNPKRDWNRQVRYRRIGEHLLLASPRQGAQKSRQYRPSYIPSFLSDINAISVNEIKLERAPINQSIEANEQQVKSKVKDKEGPGTAGAQR